MSEREQTGVDHTKPRGGGAVWVVFVLLLMLAAVAPFLMATGADDIVAWRSDYDAALADAAERDKHVFIVFTASWCSHCQTLKRAVFSEPRFKKVVEEGFVPVKVDLSNELPREKHIALAHRVEGLPTMVILDAQGKEIDRFVGGGSLRDVQAWLERVQ